RCAASARAEFPHLGRIHGFLPPGVRHAGAGDGGAGARGRRQGMTQADTSERVLRWLLPCVVLALGVVAWDLVVRLKDIPPYVLPGPGLVAATLVSDWPVLSASLLVTLITTLEGLALAVIGGIGLAVLFNQSRLVEYSFYPYAVILQVTPI